VVPQAPDELYAIVCLDALVVKVRTDRSVANRSCPLTIGVTSATNPLGVGPGEACPDAPCRSDLQQLTDALTCK
jgi:hypothetical protein